MTLIGMSYIFSTIGLIGKIQDPSVGETLSHICQYLHRHGLRVLLDDAWAGRLPNLGWTVCNRRNIGRQADLAIVVGGDGTLLNAARSLVDHQVPILGVNLGRLGFLTDVSPEEVNRRLAEILSGDYREEQRSLLHAQIIRDEHAITQADALNDVVVHKRQVARMIEVKAYMDDQYISAYRADGLIIATPTGSTAYALSGGGPIVHPSLEAVLVVPICPHTLTQRPIVVGAESEIKIAVDESNTTDIHVTCDGQVGLGIRPGDYILIRKKRRKLRLIHPSGQDYFELLRAKLHWGLRLEKDQRNP